MSGVAKSKGVRNIVQVSVRPFPMRRLLSGIWRDATVGGFLLASLMNEPMLGMYVPISVDSATECWSEEKITDRRSSRPRRGSRSSRT